MAATVIAWAPVGVENATTLVDESLNEAGWSGTGVSLTPPISTSFTPYANEVLLLLASATGNQTLSITAGWSLLTASASASGSFYVWWKRSTGTETDPTISGATNSLSLQCLHIGGCRLSGNPLERRSASNGAGTTATITAPGVIASAASALIVQPFAITDDNQIAATRTLANCVQHRTTAGQDSSAGFAWGTQTSPGATGNCTLTQTATNGDFWQTLLLVFDHPEELSDSVIPPDVAATTGAAYSRPLPADSTQPQEWIEAARAGGASDVALPTETATASEQLRGPRVATTGSVTESATPQDGVAVNAAAVTATPYITQVFPSTVTVGASFTVRGAPGLTAVSESVTASATVAETRVAPNLALTETATPADDPRAAGVARNGISESATASDALAYPGEQRTRTPVITLSTGTITVGDTFTVNGSDGSQYIAESAAASVALSCQQVYAQTLAEAVTAADELLPGAQDLTRTPTITSLSASTITAGDSFIVNGTTRRTATPSISLSANSITIGDSFTVNGSTSALTTVNEWTVPTDIVGASQAFAVTLAEAVAAAEAMAFPATAIPIPATLDATEASSITGERDFSDALLGTGEFVEWTVDAGGGGLFVLTALASSFEGAKVTLSIDDVDQATTVIPSEEEEEGRY